MKKLTNFAVNYPVTILMAILGILLLGIISYQKLGIDLFPDLNSPKVFVEIKSGERPPEEMEKLYVENIEALAIRQSGVVEVSSVSRTGSAQITVEYTWEKDMDEAFLDLQKALTSYSQNAEIDELTITQHDPNTKPVVIVGMAHETIKDMNELRKVAENYIRNELVRLEGIAEVELSGVEENEVKIETDPYKLESYNITVAELSQRIDAYNRSISGGTITETGLQYVVKGVSLLQDIEDFENLVNLVNSNIENKIFDFSKITWITPHKTIFLTSVFHNLIETNCDMETLNSYLKIIHFPNGLLVDNIKNYRENYAKFKSKNYSPILKLKIDKTKDNN